MEKFDVDIFGLWNGCNYGSIATYYVLHQVITSMILEVYPVEKIILV